MLSLLMLPVGPGRVDGLRWQNNDRALPWGACGPHARRACFTCLHHMFRKVPSRSQTLKKLVGKVAGGWGASWDICHMSFDGFQGGP